MLTTTLNLMSSPPLLAAIFQPLLLLLLLLGVLATVIGMERQMPSSYIVIWHWQGKLPQQTWRKTYSLATAIKGIILFYFIMK